MKHIAGFPTVPTKHIMSVLVMHVPNHQAQALEPLNGPRWR